MGGWRQSASRRGAQCGAGCGETTVWIGRRELAMQDYYEPKVGDVAGNFRLPSTRGKDITLKELKGQDVILYFYPRDDTPGCTAEACSFRDHEADLSKAHTVVLGVSTASRSEEH